MAHRNFPMSGFPLPPITFGKMRESNKARTSIIGKKPKLNWRSFGRTTLLNDSSRAFRADGGAEPYPIKPDASKSRKMPADTDLSALRHVSLIMFVKVRRPALYNGLYVI